MTELIITIDDSNLCLLKCIIDKTNGQIGIKKIPIKLVIVLFSLLAKSVDPTKYKSSPAYKTQVFIHFEL